MRIAPGHGQPYELPRVGRLALQDGEARPVRLPHLIATRSGRVTCRLEVDGYEELRPQAVQVEDGAVADVVFDLVPKPVRVIVESNRPDAEILRNGERLARAGQGFELEAFREHELVVRAPRHRDGVLLLERGTPSDEAATYRVDLAPLRADLRITAITPNRLRRSPVGLLVVDGVPLGEIRPPYTLAGLTQEVVTVEWRVPGFRPEAPRTVRLEPGAPNEVVFELDYEDAFFQFNVEPATARVMVGGELAGGPLVRVIPNVVYGIRIESPDHLPQTLEEAATAGERRVISASLTPRSFLLFEIEPTNAAVYVGSRRLAPGRVEVRAGVDYALDIRAPGHQPTQVHVHLEPGETRTVRATLVPRGRRR